MAHWRPGRAEVAQSLHELGVEIIDLSQRHAQRFAELKAADAAAQRHRRDRKEGPKRLSLADICCLSVALAEQWRVLTGDSYWTELGVSLDIIDYRKQPAPS